MNLSSRVRMDLEILIRTGECMITVSDPLNFFIEQKYPSISPSGEKTTPFIIAFSPMCMSLLFVVSNL